MPKSQSNRGWIWFFAALVVLGLVSVTILVRFNLAQQLKPEELSAARKLWEEKGPKNYSLTYSQLRPGTQGEKEIDKYEVNVLEKRVISVKLNGRALDRQVLHHYSMPALFDDMEDFLDQKAKPGSPRTFLRATFDWEKDGHVTYLNRSVASTREFVVISEVSLHAVSD